MQQCLKCEKFKIADHFRGRKDRGTKRRVCRECENGQNLKRYHERTSTQEAHRRAAYKYTIKRYGLTIEDYEKMIEDQNGQCLICEESPEKLHVDHDHTTGKIRGLLCHHCNVALGHAKDNPIILERMIKYLE